MSMIRELADKLKKYAAEYDLPPFGREIEETKELLRQTVDTIESLSTKLQAVNMENSGGWIDFNDKLPSNEQKVLISKDGNTLEDLFEFYFPDEYYKEFEDSELVGFLEGESPYYDGFTILKGNKNNIKWRPLPEPYKKTL